MRRPLNETHRRRVRALLAALPARSGFWPCSLAAFATSAREGAVVRRSLRFEAGTCCAHLCVEAPRRSAFRARTLLALEGAGYEPWLSSQDDVDVRRWLRSAAERRRELGLLAEMLTPGHRWPRRPLRRAPAAKRDHRSPWSAWVRVLEEVCGASIRWESVAISLQRSDRRTDGVGVDVAIVLFGRTFYVVARLWIDGRVDRGGARGGGGGRRGARGAGRVDGRGGGPAVPAAVARGAIAALRSLGFARDTPVGPTALARTSIAFGRKVRTVDAAARAGRSAFDALMRFTAEGRAATRGR